MSMPVGGGAGYAPKKPPSADQNTRDMFREIAAGTNAFMNNQTVPTAPPAGGGGTGTRSGSTSSGPTAEEKAAAANLGSIAGFNAQSARDQFDRARANYDLADSQNRQLASTQKKQNSSKSAAERFAQQKKLQSSTKGLINAAGNAMQGSGAWNLIDLLRGRTDLDTGEVLAMLTQNQNAVQNSLDESLNQNVVARNDAAAGAENLIRGVEADTAAQLNKINPKLFVKPGTGNASFGSTGFADANKTAANRATLAGYFLPPTPGGLPGASTPLNSGGGSYFDTLINSYNRR